ncbi:MAG: TetR/AcrR family transcriptional regulator [Firmicutes bacterium]|nr:TetR/AcrR family transcriptional regulator [Bacillota bacterium]
MNKQPQIQEQTRQNLRDAFWQIYKQKSIENISIREITDLAGYNRSTFYLYYNDIYELRDQIEEIVLDALQERIASVMTALPVSGNALEMMVDLYLSHGDYLYHFLETDPSFRTKWKNRISHIRPSWFHAPDGWQTDVAFEASFSMIIGAFSYWYENQESISAEDFILFLRKLLSDGILKVWQNEP